MLIELPTNNITVIQNQSRADIAREYDITPFALDRWIKNHREQAPPLRRENRS